METIMNSSFIHVVLALLVYWLFFYILHFLYFLIGICFIKCKNNKFARYCLALSIAGDTFNLWSLHASELLYSTCLKHYSKCKYWSCPNYQNCKKLED